MKKYYAVSQKYLAFTLSYLGFKFLTFDDDKYGKVYSFENNDELYQALEDIKKLRIKYNKNI